MTHALKMLGDHQPRDSDVHGVAPSPLLCGPGCRDTNLAQTASLLTEAEHLVIADYCLAAHGADPEVLIQDHAYAHRVQWEV